MELLKKLLLEKLQAESDYREEKWVKKNVLEREGFNCGYGGKDIRQAMYKIENYTSNVGSVWDKEQRCVMMMWYPWRPEFDELNQSALDEWYESEKVS